MTDWDRIVRDYGPMVWRTACRLLTREADVADCFQRTFLAAVEQAGTEPVRNWAGFLKRIATARALEQLRTRYRESRRATDFPDVPPIDPNSPDPADLAGTGELVEALRAALLVIDPTQAEVFCLVCLEDLGYRDAAEQLGVTPNHAGVLLNRARAALRDRLAAFNPNREHSSGGLS